MFKIPTTTHHTVTFAHDTHYFSTTQNGHVIINLAPGNLAKSGTGFDLPIALAILQASGQVNIPNRENTEFIGELGLFGELRTINGILT